MSSVFMKVKHTATQACNSGYSQMERFPIATYMNPVSAANLIVHQLFKHAARSAASIIAFEKY